MKVIKNIHELIGNTPIDRNYSISIYQGVRIFAKLEFLIQEEV